MTNGRKTGVSRGLQRPPRTVLQCSFRGPNRPIDLQLRVERVTGIEPAWPAWKAGALPLSYTREVLAQPNGLLQLLVRQAFRSTCDHLGAWRGAWPVTPVRAGSQRRALAEMCAAIRFASRPPPPISIEAKPVWNSRPT